MTGRHSSFRGRQSGTSVARVGGRAAKARVKQIQELEGCRRSPVPALSSQCCSASTVRYCQPRPAS